MNIEISDEQIEKILEKQISERVKTWFSQYNNKYVIQDHVERAVKDELMNLEYKLIIQQEARKQITKQVLDKVCASISSDIAEAFADKYGGY